MVAHPSNLPHRRHRHTRHCDLILALTRLENTGQAAGGRQHLAVPWHWPFPVLTLQLAPALTQNALGAAVLGVGALEVLEWASIRPDATQTTRRWIRVSPSRHPNDHLPSAHV
jgi:hypothetical protein